MFVNSKYLKCISFNFFFLFFPINLRSLWEDLKHCRTPLVLVVGEEDEKFKGVAQKMWKEIGHVSKLHEMVVVPNCGHAVHLENPLPIIRLVRQFLTRLKSDPSSKK